MARPKKLQTVVTDQIEQSLVSRSREMFVNAVRDKLREHDVNADRFPVEEFIEKVLSGNAENFAWRDELDSGRDRTVSLDFTDDEIRELFTQIDKLLKRSDTFIQECLDAAAKALLRRLERRYPDQKSDEEVELFGFIKRLEQRWGAPLDLYKMMLIISRELFGGEVESLRRSRATTGLNLREALLGIHARTLRTATAVLVLLENGLADDAYARWRTLYELSVAAAFLSIHGEKAAERYLLHEAVVLKQRLDNERSWGGKKITKKQQSEIERNYNAVVSAFGQPFKKPYGWAAGLVDGNNNPKFVDLEEAVKGQMIVPPYKESSLQVHGGRAGLLGLGSSDDVAAIGHSNLGLDIPLMHSSLCLMQVTSIHLYHSPSRDVMLLKVLVFLNEKIERRCRKVAKELAQEEAAIQRGSREGSID